MTKDLRINSINIGLMIASCIAAFIMPFEVFLFAYAVLGPLHYLTEISWLHDRQYFAKGKYDNIVLWFIGVLVLLASLAQRYQWNWPFEDSFTDKIIFVALAGSVLMVFVKNVFLKVIGILFVLVVSNAIFGSDPRDGLAFFIGALIPTLIHVFVFTGFFILYGALKSRSKSGIISFFVFLVCPLLLFLLFRTENFVPVTNYGLKAYGTSVNGDGFFGLNVSVMEHFFNVHFPPATDSLGNMYVYKDTNIPYPDYSSAPNLVFHSQNGILLMRFIAFAYTYHYLNWFSKTEVIRWHKVPKARFIGVLILWVVSLILYGINYSLGLRWLYFLSFCHVLLEFPLNVVSITGIGKELITISKNGFKPVAVGAGKGR